MADVDGSAAQAMSEVQHNIVAIVGNGFDLGIFAHYGWHTDTRYETFYHFLCMRNTTHNKVLLELLKKAKTNDQENWSDIELLMVEARKALSDHALANELNWIRSEFVEFLNIVVRPELINRLDTDSPRNSWAAQSFGRFLADVSKTTTREALNFPSRTDHYHVFRYTVLNLNYTSLLDNYLWLDRKQHPPHPHLTVDTNFGFWPNPDGELEYGDDKTRWSCYLEAALHHPHGMQSVPRSLLFGNTEPLSMSRRSSEQSCIDKAHWGQLDRTYGQAIAEAELFLIYGCSLGETDTWWWQRIVQCLADNPLAEVLLYAWSEKAPTIECENTARQKFLSNAKHDQVCDSIKQRIHVIAHGPGTPTVWLGRTGKQGTQT